ncbi:MAG: GxxExxY protein [bacterium]
MEISEEYQENLLTEIIIQCIIKTHQTLGPGFLESIYRRAMVIELTKQGLRVETEKEILIYYEGEEVEKHRLDILVESKVIVELKTVEELSKAHYAQVRSYLKATGVKVALLVNFAKEKADFRRVELE